MARARLETPRDLVRAVLRAKSVVFPLRTLHRVPREAEVEGLSVAWHDHLFSFGDFYEFARDCATVVGTPEGLAMLGLHILAQAVGLEDAPRSELRLRDRQGQGAHECPLLRIEPPFGPRPALKAPAWTRAEIVERHPWRKTRVLDRPRFGLTRASGQVMGARDLAERDVFSIGGTRVGLRALAFLLFDLVADRRFESDVQLEGPEGFDNVAVPSCEAQIWSPFSPLAASYYPVSAPPSTP
jgi:hypothetical protein